MAVNLINVKVYKIRSIFGKVSLLGARNEQSDLIKHSSNLHTSKHFYYKNSKD